MKARNHGGVSLEWYFALHDAFLCPLSEATLSWSPSSPSTHTPPTASASSSTPRGSTSPRAAQMRWSACGTWRSWCVCAASHGEGVHTHTNILSWPKQEMFFCLLMCSVCVFVCVWIEWLARSHTHWFTVSHSLTLSPARSLAHSLSHSLSHSLPLTHSHSLTHSLILSLTLSFSHSLTHWLTHLCPLDPASAVPLLMIHCRSQQVQFLLWWIAWLMWEL